MIKIRNYILTIELLDAYQNAALKNAGELLEEAQLLFSKAHYAGAYFLSIASIEESGKAYIAFDAKGRNLKDGGVCKKIKEKFENHPNKITAAFSSWITFSDKTKEAIKTCVDLMVQLEYGREKSMYIDVKDNGSVISIPAEVVRPVAARDCVNIAVNCLHHTKLYIQKNVPPKRSSYQDKFMCIKQSTLTALLNSADFWEFYSSLPEKGESSWMNAAVTYHDRYYQKKKKFKNEIS
ncbi:MAG: AbiV family abortive infection protein [Candidatus Latescibacter sp.]|nr:AbiV family abortive infection protein [Candidatus Latescibacter sp.]